MLKSVAVALFLTSVLASAALPVSVSGIDLSSNKKIDFDLRDKTAVLVFLSSKCPCSMSHEKKLRSYAQKYSKTGISFLGINSNSDESIEAASTHFASSLLGFPVIKDKNSKLADEFRALKTPHVFVLKNGALVYQGGVDDSQSADNAKEEFLAKALEDLLANREIKNASTRTLGCIIKR